MISDKFKFQLIPLFSVITQWTNWLQIDNIGEHLHFTNGYNSRLHCKLIITGLLKHATLQHLSLILTLVILWTGYHNCNTKKEMKDIILKYHTSYPISLHNPPPKKTKTHKYSIYRKWFQNNFHYIFLKNVSSINFHKFLWISVSSNLNLFSFSLVTKMQSQLCQENFHWAE